MSNKSLSRREFLRISALTGAGLAVVACVPAPQPGAPAAEPAAANTPEPAAPAAEGITLDVVMDTPEYQNQHRQIFDIFEEENPGITINYTTHSEDGQQAYVAKVAGGYTPAMETAWSSGNSFRINKDNFDVAVDLSTIDYPYFGDFLYDLEGSWANIYGEPGPRLIDPFLGVVMTWMFHQDLLEPAGLNPIGRVNTWDDLKAWHDEGAAWAKTQDMIWWDQGWLNPWFGWHLHYDTIPLAFPDGQREQQLACWRGEKPFNAEDSPYRHTPEFYKEAYDKGWLPQNFWTRKWEEDMESSFAAKKSAVMLHGPWPWDKTLGIDPAAQQAGLPATPPAEGQTQWMQLQSDPGLDTGSQAMFIRTGNESKPEWEQVKQLFIWWHSPEIIKLRGEAIGFIPAVKLDPPADLQGPQLVDTVLEIEKPGGKWEQVKWERSVSGETQMGAQRKGGSPGVWDVESGNIAKNWADMMTGALSVQEYLDMAQANYEASYTQ
ncbi:MAG: ABC transporter substrate-binding protein [Chloroflexota bacterium]|nr:ABC transporter substrate-binding protein [Chloroflexota bacterium]